ncbi:hypothetical protein V8J88_06335 [Massilia sp. W12]|uniref:hypothetical protein n=1 Tax=Massilia sp. W12 TaxID=3126507 RepID=UPI0030CAAF30
MMRRKCARLAALAHDLHLPQGRLSLRLCTHLSEQHPAGRAYPIRFAIHARHLITRCVLHQESSAANPASMRSAVLQRV